MIVRLLRALQRGGCIVEMDEDSWSVWRSPDRRGRAIGQVPAGEVQMLVVQGNLSPLGQFHDGRLVWSGQLTAPRYAPSASALVTEEDRLTCRRKSLLQRLLERNAPLGERRRLARAALDFSGDVERAECGPGLRSMNWQAISGGTRVQGGRTGPGTYQGSTAFAAACRLTALQEALGLATFRLLERIIVEAATRHAIANWLALRPGDAERQALKAIRQLASVYDRQLKLPERSLPQSP